MHLAEEKKYKTHVSVTQRGNGELCKEANVAKCATAITSKKSWAATANLNSFSKSSWSRQQSWTLNIYFCWTLFFVQISLRLKRKKNKKNIFLSARSRWATFEILQRLFTSSLKLFPFFADVTEIRLQSYHNDGYDELKITLCTSDQGESCCTTDSFSPNESSFKIGEGSLGNCSSTSFEVDSNDFWITIDFVSSLFRYWNGMGRMSVQFGQVFAISCRPDKWKFMRKSEKQTFLCSTGNVGELHWSEAGIINPRDNIKKTMGSQILELRLICRRSS